MWPPRMRGWYVASNPSPQLNFLRRCSKKRLKFAEIPEILKKTPQGAIK